MPDNDIEQVVKQHLELMFEDNRLATFKSWVFDDEQKCNAAKMAEAGFLFTGTKADPDAVKCFLCQKSLDSWDPDDDPWTEHLNHSRNCMFAKLQKPERVLTVSELFELKHEVITSAVNKITADNQKQINEQLETVTEILKALK